MNYQKSSKMLMLLVLALGIVSLVSGATTSEFYEGTDEPFLCKVYVNGTEEWINQANEFDLFDDDFNVGDAFYIDVGHVYLRTYNQYSGVIMNVTTVVVADTYEFAIQRKTGGVWVNVSDLGDDTEQFSKTGQLRIGWAKESTDATSLCGKNYYWYRILVTEVTNPSEGGHIGNGDDKQGMYFSPSSTMNITAGSGTLNDLVNDDKGTTRTLINNRTAGLGMNLSLQIHSPVNKPIPITFKVEQAGDWNINITYEDGDSNSYNMNLSGSGNGSVLTLPFLNIDYINTAGIGYITIEQDRWGCIDRDAHYPKKTNSPEMYSMLDCVWNIGSGVSVDYSTQVLLRKGVEASSYGRNKFYTYLTNVDGTLKCGGTVDGFGTSTGYLLTSQWTGWNEMGIRLGGLFNSSACVFGGYDADTTWERRASGIDLSTGSNSQFLDSFLAGGDRYRFNGVAIDITRLMLANWKRIETSSGTKYLYNTWLLGGAGDNLLFAGSTGEIIAYDGIFNGVYPYFDDVYLIDSSYNTLYARSVYQVWDRHRVNLTITDYASNPIKNAEVTVYNQEGFKADAGIGNTPTTFPLTSDVKGNIYTEVTKIKKNNTDDYDFSNFTITVTANGYCEKEINGIPLNDKFIGTITLNRAGIYTCTDELSEEFR